MIRSWAQEGVDHAADAVVGQTAVEGLDELGGGEVADPMPGVDGGDAERDQQMALTSAGNARLALNARWVNRRWKPAVIPRAPSR